MGRNSVDAVPLDKPSQKHPLDCPVEHWLSVLGHRWTALLLWHLKLGAKRHGELAVLLPGVSPKVLTERLEGLEHYGLIRRSALPTFPRGMAYSLTQRGVRLVDILDQIERWSREVSSHS